MKTTTHWKPTSEPSDVSEARHSGDAAVEIPRFSKTLLDEGHTPFDRRGWNGGECDPDDPDDGQEGGTMEVCPLDQVENPPSRWREVHLTAVLDLDHSVEITAKVCKDHTEEEIHDFAERWVVEHLAAMAGSLGVAA